MADQNMNYSWPYFSSKYCFMQLVLLILHSQNLAPSVKYHQAITLPCIHLYNRLYPVVFQKSGRQVLHSTGICNSFKIYSLSFTTVHVPQAYGLKYKSIKLNKQLTMIKEAKDEKKALKSHQFRKENSFLGKGDMKFLPTKRASCQKCCSFFLGGPPFSPNSIYTDSFHTNNSRLEQSETFCCFYSVPEWPSHSSMTSQKKSQHTAIFSLVFSFSHDCATFS